MDSNALSKVSTQSEETGVPPIDGKRCTKCREVKPLDAFSLSGKPYTEKTKGRHSQCKQCARAFYNARYHSSARYKERTKANGLKAYAIAKQRYARYIQHRGGACELCLKKYPLEVFHFHHINPAEKEQGLGLDKWTGSRSRFLKTLEECEKCALLCANCHIIVHTQLREGNDILGDKYRDE